MERSELTALMAAILMTAQTPLGKPLYRADQALDQAEEIEANAQVRERARLTADDKRRNVLKGLNQDGTEKTQ